MAFYCPNCQTKEALQIMSNVDLPADERSDEIAIQIIECQHCGKRGMGIYEESRRGAMEEEHWSHTGYWLDFDAKIQLDLLLETCTGVNSKKSMKTLIEYYKNKFAGSPIQVDWNSGFVIEK